MYTHAPFAAPLPNKVSENPHTPTRADFRPKWPPQIRYAWRMTLTRAAVAHTHFRTVSKKFHIAHLAIILRLCQYEEFEMLVLPPSSRSSGAVFARHSVVARRQGALALGGTGWCAAFAGSEALAKFVEAWTTRAKRAAGRFQGCECRGNMYAVPLFTAIQRPISGLLETSVIGGQHAYVLAETPVRAKPSARQVSLV